MCFWESTQDETRLRQSACQAALEIRDAVEVFNQQQNEDRRIGVRIGLHAGWVHVGKVGPVGEVLNTVSRIERANERLCTRILASEEVITGLDGFTVRRLGAFELKGKIKPMSIFEVIGLSSQATENELELCRKFHAALAAFEALRWSEAARMCSEILSRCGNDGPTGYYRDLALEYLTTGSLPDNPRVIKLQP